MADKGEDGIRGARNQFAKSTLSKELAHCLVVQVRAHHFSSLFIFELTFSFYDETSVMLRADQAWVVVDNTQFPLQN